MGNANSATRLIIWVAFLLTVASQLPLAQATVLPPGKTVLPSSLVPGGTLKAALSGTIGKPAFFTDYYQWVFSDPFNTRCSNCLDFVYQFHDRGPGSNKRFEMSGFAGFITDVGTNPFGVNDPAGIDRSANGDLIGFNYSPAIVEFETTPFLVIETDACATCFALGGSLDVLGRVGDPDGVVRPAIAYVPVAVPEPASVAMLGGGLTVIGALLRKLRLGKAD